MGWDDLPLEVSSVHRAAFSVELHSDDDHLTLKACGNLDLSTMGRLRPALIACADPQCTVTLDLTDATFSNMVTVAALAWTARQVRRRESRLLVRGLTRSQAQVLRLGGASGLPPSTRRV